VKRLITGYQYSLHSPLASAQVNYVKCTRLKDQQDQMHVNTLLYIYIKSCNQTLF